MTSSWAVSYPSLRMNLSTERMRANHLSPVMFEGLQITIPYRDSKLTRAALKFAATLIDGQNARVRLIDVHVVPYGVSISQPTTDPKLERRLKSLARDYEVPVSAEVVYARDWEQGFRRVLTPGSIVLLPMRRAWWSTSEKRMAERLRKLGHTVIWVESN